MSARSTLAAMVCLVAWNGPARAQAVTANDPVFRRAQRLVSEGNGATGRAVVDSVLAATADNDPRHAEAMFWSATLSESAAKAERDYLKLTVEHALSPWAGEALLRLGQLQYARGERSLALRHFERLVMEHGDGTLGAQGSFWKGRVLLEQGDVARACPALAAAKASAPAAASELRNQVDYYIQRCIGVDTTGVASAPTARAAGRDSTPPRPAGRDASARPPTARRAPQTPTLEPGWTVQVAAYRTEGEAQREAQKLTARGFDARVHGDASPYRVRIGRYATRASAVAAVGRMKKSRVPGIVVRAEPE